jgi:uncharacterized protein (TIGR02246 family)
LKAVVILVLVLALAAVAYPQVGIAPPSIAAIAQCNDANGSLNTIAEQWKAAYNDGNAAKVAALYAEDAYYLTQHYVTGIVHGRAAIQAYVHNGVDAHYQVDRIEVLKQECVGDFAYTVTRYESTNAGQKAFGLNIVVLKKIGGRWMIVAHESTVPDPTTAIQHLKIPETSVSPDRNPH